MDTETKTNDNAPVLSQAEQDALKLMNLHSTTSIKSVQDIEQWIHDLTAFQSTRWPPVATKLNDLNRRLNRITKKFGTSVTDVVNTLVGQGRAYLISDSFEYRGSGALYVFNRNAVDTLVEKHRGDQPTEQARRNHFKVTMAEEQNPGG